MTGNDHKVRRLIAHPNGGNVPLADILRLCPYRSLLARLDRPLAPDVLPTVIVAALGFVPEDFSDQMRTDIIAAIRQGEIVGLVSNSAELRDYAKREIALAMCPAGGAA